MKKIISLFLTLVLLLGLCACTQAEPAETTLTTQLQTTLPATTQLSTQPQTQVSTQPPQTQAVTQAATQPPVQPPTQPPVQRPPQTQAATTRPETQAATEAVTQPQTQPPTLPPTQPQTQPPTQPQTQPPTQPQTQPPTQPQTQPPTQPQTQPPTQPPTQTTQEDRLDENGWYYSRDEVALYIHLYHHLPGNFITKAQKKEYGKNYYTQGYSIGGDRFYNKEGHLPSGNTYYECDIDTAYSANRGAKRIVFTMDGQVWYTANHYASFEKIY